MTRSDVSGSFLPVVGSSPATWLVTPGLVDYEAAVAAMDKQVAAIAAGRTSELVWLLEHPSIYTAGTAAREPDVGSLRFPTYRAGRGGQYTYHGPGQRVAYVMLDLSRRRPDLRAFVATLESWIMSTLAVYGIAGERREDRVGVWVQSARNGASGHEDKIAALGIRVRRWVSLHGIAVNIAPDLSHFGGIVPCGISDPDRGVTSLADLGVDTDRQTFDRRLRSSFETYFGPTVDPSGTSFWPAEDRQPGQS